MISTFILESFWVIYITLPKYISVYVMHVIKYHQIKFTQFTQFTQIQKVYFVLNPLFEMESPSVYFDIPEVNDQVEWRCK
jgi:hypothetical protein